MMEDEFSETMGTILKSSIEINSELIEEQERIQHDLDELRTFTGIASLEKYVDLQFEDPGFFEHALKELEAWKMRLEQKRAWSAKMKRLLKKWPNLHCDGCLAPTPKHWGTCGSLLCDICLMLTEDSTKCAHCERHNQEFFEIKHRN